MEGAVDIKSKRITKPNGTKGLELALKIAHVVSHDLRAPVNHIRSYLKLLDRDLDEKLINERVKQDLRAITVSAERMEALINALAFFSRIPLQVEWQYVSTKTCLNSAVQRLRELFLAHNVVLETGELPDVQGDAEFITQLLEQLIHNAIIYNHSDPIWLECFAVLEDDEWVFCIKDNGDGVPLSQQKKIFDPSFRLHSLRDYPGVGMGLAICQRIVEAHQGRIWIESSGIVGQGSTFKYVLGSGAR